MRNEEEEEEEEDEDEDEEEEVRCVCPTCGAEGVCLVTKMRANELKEQGLLEENCPYYFGSSPNGCANEQGSSSEEDTI